MNKSARTLIERYGKDYFSRLGKKGAKVFYERYFLYPIELNKFGIFRKDNNQFVNYLGMNKVIK